MKKSFLITQLTLLLILVIGTGCSKKSTRAKSVGSSTPTVVSTDRNDDTLSSATGGTTVSFKPESLSIMEAYTGRGLDEIKNIKINLNFEDVDPSNIQAFAGEVRITYDEVLRDPVTGEVTETVSRGGRFDSGDSVYDAQYNKWYGGAFKAFVQDAIGSLVVIFDEETNDLGTWSGRVYFKNFNLSICNTQWPGFCAPQPWRADGSLLRCWFIKESRSPYYCRDFEVGGEIRPDLVQYPTNYRLLGKFENVDVKEALNIED